MSTQQWQWDEVPHYRLTASIIDSFLKEKFGNYSTFYTEVKISDVLIGKTYKLIASLSTSMTHSDFGFREDSGR